MKKIVGIPSVADDKPVKSSKSEEFNHINTLADEDIADKYDSGSDRIEKLTKEEHNAEAVQEEVNKKLGGISAIKVGDSVKIVGAMYCTGEYIPGWVKETRHIISQIDGNRVLLGAGDGINSWIYLKDISK